MTLSGTFDKYLSQLRRLQLVDGSGPRYARARSGSREREDLNRVA